MRVRRALLACGLGLVSASAFGGSEPAAVDLQAGPYGGSADGKWTCGPRGSVKYGGGAGQVKVDLSAERTPFLPKRSGLNVDLKGAIEHRDYVIECGAGSRCPGPDGTYRAGSATLGFDAKWLSGNFGVMAYSKVSQAGARKTIVLPEVRLRGPILGDTTRLELGFGSPTLFSVMRPGLYGGASVGGERRDLVVTMGAMRTFEDTYAFRMEGQFRAALGSAAWIGVAGALQAYKQGRGEIGGILGVRAF